MLRTLSLALLATALLPRPLHAADAPATAAPEAAISARIDGSLVVTTAEVDALAESMLRANGQGVPPDQQAAMQGNIRQRAIDQMVMQKLLLRAADAANVTVSDEEVAAFFKARLPEGTSIADVAKGENMTEAKLRSEVASNLRINKMLEQKVAAVPPATDEELKTAFDEMVQRRPDFADMPEQVEARHILLKCEPGATDAEKAKAREKLEGIRKQIVDGADFAELAKEHSDCPSGKRAGGSLGTFGRGQMVKPFEDAAFSQAPGAVGEVITTDFGYHIVQVVEKKPAGKRTLESERKQLSDMVTRKKKGEIANSFMEGLKTSAKIEVLEQPPAPPPAPAEQRARELPVWAQ